MYTSTTDLPGCHRLTDHLLVGSIAEYAAPFTPATLERLEAAGVDYVLSLVGKAQFNAAGTGALSGSASGASTECSVRRPAPVYLSYAFWPEGRDALPTARQVRRVLDEIDDFLSVGRTILLSGAGHPARAILMAGCWRARHGPKERGSRTAREWARLGWLREARAATASRVTRSAWNFGAAGRAFVGAWPAGKEGEPVRTYLELLEADDVYPWATADYWLEMLSTVRVYPEGRQGDHVDAPVVDGQRISDGAGIDLTLADLHAGTWTGERTLLLLDGGVVVFMSPFEHRDPAVQARRQRRSEWFTFQAGDRHCGVQFLPLRCLEGYTSAQTAALEASEAYEVSLRVEEHPLARVNVVAGYGMVVRDDARHMLSAVTQGIVDWAQRQRPMYLYWFTGDTREQRLLARIVRRFAARGNGMRRLDTDPFTGRPCAPEVFWLGRNPRGATEPTR